MRRSTFLSFSVVHPLLLLLLLPPAVSSSSPSESLYANFLNCLENRTQSPSSSSSSTYQFSQSLFSQSNSSYSGALNSYVRNRRFNTSSTPKPLLILTPSLQSHVSAAVLCSKHLGLLIRTRSGGHDYEGLSYASSRSDDPFIVLDTFNFRAIDVDVAGESAWVGSGATVGELYYRIWEKSRVHGFPAGVCPTVGIGGHFSGGGYGNMLRKFGLSVDNIVDAKIVDVDGRVLDRASMGEDLFWAIRGGGGASFGVILAYRIKLVRVPETVTVFRVEKTVEHNATEMVYRWQYVAPATDNGLFMRLLLRPITLEPRKGEKTVRASVYTLFLGDAERLISIMARDFPELGLSKVDCKEMSWIDSVLWWGRFENGTGPEALLDRMPDSVNFLKRKSDYVREPIPRDGLDSLWDKMTELGKAGLVFNPYGGVLSEIASSETPFPHRAGNLFKIQYSISWSEEGTEAANDCLSQMRSLYSFMTPFVSKDPRRAYLNYRDLDIGVARSSGNSYGDGSVYGVKYFVGNFERLVNVKTAVDPENFFRNEQSIPPLPSKSRTGSTSSMARHSTLPRSNMKLIESGILVSLLIWGNFFL
ncbi:berberine bridge enzyme-like 21 [Punica granatum]|uniref:Berberine bridge enzyme-like 21 n=1 Tax=Punica granatum TaxID=22663 RepID=A0A6P8DFD0_PUNGR|nr:berberine bridge enzyme-like 21 [Punica granatum]